MAVRVYAGTVKELRIFKDDLLLFIEAYIPQKFRGKIVRFVLNEQNCCVSRKDYTLETIAKLIAGDRVIINRFYDKNDKSYGGYVLERVNSGVIDAEDIVYV